MKMIYLIILILSIVSLNCNAPPCDTPLHCYELALKKFEEGMQKLAEATKEISDLKTIIQNQNEVIAKLQNTINKHDSEINAQQAEINDVTSKVNNLYAKKLDKLIVNVLDNGGVLEADISFEGTNFYAYFRSDKRCGFVIPGVAGVDDIDLLFTRNRVDSLEAQVSTYLNRSCSLQGPCDANYPINRGHWGIGGPNHGEGWLCCNY